MIAEMVNHAFCGGEELPRYWLHERVLVGPSIMGAHDVAHLRDDLRITGILSLESEQADPGADGTESDGLLWARHAFPDDGQPISATTIRASMWVARCICIDHTLPNRRPGRIYVHCRKGRCRSPAIAYGICRTLFGMTHDEVVARVREAHPDFLAPDHVRVPVYLSSVCAVLGLKSPVDTKSTRR